MKGYYHGPESEVSKLITHALTLPIIISWKNPAETFVEVTPKPNH